MLSNNVSEYVAFRETTKRLLRVTGLWPSEKINYLYRLLPYVQLFLSFGTVLAISRYVQVNFTDVRLVTKGMSIMTSFLSVILKILCLNINRESLMELHHLLDTHFNNLLKDPTLSQEIARGATTFRRLALILMVFTVIPCFVYVVIPLIFIAQQHRHGVQPVRYILVFPGIYPWDIPPNGLLYKIHYFYESMACMPLICITPGADSLFTLYAFQLLAQFREMSHRIRFSKDDYKLVIRQCVQQHTVIMKSRDILQAIYGPVVIWIILTNAVVLCSLIFQVSQMRSISIFQGTLFGTYIILKLTQTYTYALVGSCITEESENYRRAIYAANWYSNKEFMTSILIMLAQKPINLTACKFSTVSIDIFAMVLNTSASYFFLLRTIHED